MTRRSTVAILTRTYCREAIQTRLFSTLVVSWISLITLGIAVTSENHTLRRRARELAVAKDREYMDQLPNFFHLFQNFYTLRRPTSALSPLVAGVEHIAPDNIDYRPRFSPTFYYDDDVDPLLRIFPAPDLIATVGVVGAIIALLVCFNAFNGEIDRRTAHLLLVNGVRASEIYLAKVLSHSALLIGGFAIAYFAAIPLYAWISREAIDPVALLALMGACSLYLFVCVALFSTISVLARSSSVSFFVGATVVVLEAYAIPYGVELSVSKLRPLQYTQTDLMQDKVIRSRILHIDTDKQMIESLDTFPRTGSEEAKKMTETDWKARLRHAIEKHEEWDFVMQNSEATIEMDERYFSALYDQNGSIMTLASGLSPFMALSHALASFADTSIDAEATMTRYAGVDFFRRYRDWWLLGNREGSRFEDVPIDRWIFAPSKKKLDLDEIGPLRFPRRVLAKRFADAAWAMVMLVLFGSFAFGLGWWRSERVSLIGG